MTNADAARRARRSLSTRLGKLGTAETYRPPPRGWIRAIRDALGMSAAELGRRMGITGPAVTTLERSEREHTIQLNTLRRAAEAMNCSLVYVFVPKDGLEETVRNQAQRIARNQLSHVATTMALEDQAVDVADDLLHRQIEEIIRAGKVWSAHL